MSLMTGRLAQLNISPGGMPKRPIDRAFVTKEGVPGDWQKNRKYHGGRNRAICLFSLELYEQLRAEEFDISPGDLGENFTMQGIDLNALKIGGRLRVGDCLIEIANVRVPCKSLHQWHPELMKALVGRSGWVCKVIEEGNVRINDEIAVLG